MRPVFMRIGISALWLAAAGCGPARPTQFKDGAKLYEREGHRYFGRVVGFAESHDFHNGMPPQPAILIEPASGGAVGRTWGACGTCEATFDVEP